jgi:hypothetical protein
MAGYTELQWFQDGRALAARLEIDGVAVEVNKVFENGNWLAWVLTLNPLSPSILGRSKDPDEKSAVEHAIAEAQDTLRK